jgi:uncharacterized membrane protein YphA (DoxX/SURF4 family)
MSRCTSFAQLFLRLALGAGFIYPVMDRLGWLGAPDSGKAVWGNWDHFVAYTHTLLPFLNTKSSGIMAFLATISEAVFGISLIAGFKTRIVAIGSSLLTFIFAICMTFFISPDAALKYPVFVFCAAGLLLATIPFYKWSIDFALRSK